MTKLFLAAFLFFSVTATAIENPLAEVERKLNATTSEEVQLSVEKQQLETQIQELQIKIKERKIVLIKRLKALYAIKKYRWGELFSNPDLNSLSRNIKILGNLNAYDYELFKDYNASFKLLAQARKNLVETEALLQNNIKVLRSQQLEFQKLEDVRIASLQQDNISSLLSFKGKLSRPLDGKPEQEFGSMREQFGQYYLINRGQLYKAKKTPPIKSIGLGVVIFRDLLAGWRETLIIQHDDNYYSVYAGVKNSKKAVGDRVGKDEVIGLAAGDEFYFELRHFDNPINPKKWFRE